MQFVAHSGHLRPGDVTERATKLRRHVLCRLSDHLIVPENGVDGPFVVDELAEWLETGALDRSRLDP